ncbi:MULTISPECIES: alanine racemase [Bacillaceae]|uniref:Alanine racemase n=1 Tax=Evansella alkalicola TaxID=745819 RepID=A0ABS6JZ75_9BACI|nr:alanine racemase [Litchfieldia alkalitelluris]MBU9723798.1 alanine racemase [Bacillus alkalicola]
MEGFYRDTWVEINLDALKENVRNIRKMLPENVRFMAAVKANGYGHGAVDVAKAALEEGASYLGVAILDEALAIRKAGITAPILVMGYVRPENVKLAIEKDIELTVFQGEWLEKTLEFLDGTTKELKCHIKIDTGMGRIGIRTKEEGNALISVLKNSSNFIVNGIYTHFATADELDVTYYKKQQQRFREMVTWFEQELEKEIELKHCGNSAATLRFPDELYNMVRVGIAMYGLTPSTEMKDLIPVSLKEVFSLHSTVTHIKHLPEGHGVSYGATYRATGQEWVATVPIGYADGWIRANSGGFVLINGSKAPIVGRICMDQMMIALPEYVAIGTEVTLIGKQENEIVSMDDVAKRLNTINYEIPCTISYRVPRVVIENKEVRHVHNEIF